MKLSPGVASYALILSGHTMVSAIAGDGHGGGRILSIFAGRMNASVTRPGVPSEIWWDGNQAVVWPVPTKEMKLEMMFVHRDRVVLPVDPAWRQEYERELKERAG